jgi:putative membrane protein
MRGFVIGTIATAIAFAVMIWLLPNIDYKGDVVPGLLIIALIAGVVNGLIKPIVRLLALPVRMATLGLVGFVINAGMLLLIAWISDKLDISFTIAGFPPVVGSIVLSIVSTVIGLVIHD